MLEVPRTTREQLRDRLQNDPEYFFRKVLKCDPWQRQVDIMNSVRDYRVTSVRSCHASGKSWTSARIALWYLISHPDSIVITTAPTGRQVKAVLWREINGAVEGSSMPLGGKCKTVEYDLGPQWFAMGLSTDDPDKFQGFHADRLLAIVDEAAGIDEPIFEAIRAITTGVNNRVLFIGNPTALAGTFYNSHRSPTVSKIKISAFDTPNFTANNIHTISDLIEAIESNKVLIQANPKLVSPIAVYEDLKEWGEDSPMFQARILGEFPSQAEDTLIPLNKVEAAMDEERRDKIPAVGKISYGVDVARFGSDKTTILERIGDRVTWVKAYTKEDTMQTTGRVMELVKQNPDATINVDVIGVGAGVFDRLIEIRNQFAKQNAAHALSPVNVAEKAIDPDRFINRRAEVYWILREQFINNEIAIPKDEELMSELAQLKFKFTSRGQIQIEEKSEMKKRLGKSPDRADALMLSYAASPIGTFSDLSNFPDDTPVSSITGSLMDKQF